jgi:two-component system aerobic respiration control sensor histidine kinase ArcB
MDFDKELKTIKDYYENIIALMPGHVYWMDKNNVFLGCNNLQAKAANLSSRKAIIGKRNSDMIWKDQADALDALNLKVMQSGKPYATEEYAVMGSGAGVYLSHKVPLFDENQQVIGLVGISLDITAQKEAEKLKLENVIQKAELAAQAKFTKNAYSVAHDIRSPLSTLLLIVKNCKEISEDKRIALREIAVSIGDIANNLLSKYGDKEIEDHIEEQKPLLLSAVLLHLISDKKHQYKESGHKFYHDFTQIGQRAFIKIQQSLFKRMISNLINNAVDAFENMTGEVIIKLDATDDKVLVVISDNGKGMPDHVKEKILQNIAVTEGKAEGHGLGLTQVRETLVSNQGVMRIDSQIGKGTQIKLEFPRIKAPNWIAEEIRIRPDDTVVILDDDKSIHMAWDMRFEDLLRQYPQMRTHHFENCHDAIRFIESFSNGEKAHIYLLTDFELLEQELNGLHVIEKTKITHSTLVTSHYADSVVLNRVSHMKTKILPKQLAPEIPIIVEQSVQASTDIASKEVALKQVDAILVDDDKRFADMLIQYVFGDNKIDYFEDPYEFMEKIKNYPKNTRIYLDNHYKTANLTGFTLAKELYEKGYAKLYLLTGDTFKPGQAPDYVKVIRKDDIENIKDWN